VPLPSAFAVKAGADDTEGRLSVLEVTVALDIPRHVHHEADECIYVLDGVLAIEFEGEQHLASAGTFTLLPRGVPHALRRASTPAPRVLQISSPGGWERHLEDLIEAGPAVFTEGALDPVKMNPISAKHAVAYEEHSRDQSAAQ